MKIASEPVRDLMRDHGTDDQCRKDDLRISLPCDAVSIVGKNQT